MLIYFVLNFIKQRKKNMLAHEIKQLEARMSSLRMILKAKVKKKSQHFRTSMASSIKSGDPLDCAILKLAELQFEANEHFEMYFSVSKQMNIFLKIDRPSYPVQHDFPIRLLCFLQRQAQPDFYLVWIMKGEK